MVLNKQTILNRTHYGLNIYAYVLRQYYKNETVLSLSGRVCKPVKNPFNEGKTTLMIRIENNCAIHTDTEEAINKGDAFAFAELHFKIKGQALCNKLNEVMHLNIGQENRFNSHENEIFEEPEQEVIKAKSPNFSFYEKPITNIIPTKEMTLTEAYKLIRSENFRTSTNALREIKNVKKARRYKAFNFDYATFSGLFSKRNDKYLKRHSGLLTIDFDHLKDITTLKKELLKDEYFETELLFTSPSGDGLKWIIPIELTKVKHKDYFKAVANYVKHKYKIEVDGSGKDISRACFLPHDPNVFINQKYL